jgi:hypothetical protein
VTENKKTYVEIRHAENGYAMRFGHWSGSDKDSSYFVEENPVRAGDRLQSYLEGMLKKAAKPKKKPAS